MVGTNIGPYINIPGLITKASDWPKPAPYKPPSKVRFVPRKKATTKAATKATTAGGRKGSPSAAATPKAAAVKAAPHISLAALERSPQYGYGSTLTGHAQSQNKSTGKSSGSGSSSGGGGGSGTPTPAAPPPPNPLDVLQTQLGGQLDALFKGLATTQTGIRDDYDARSAALLSQLEGYYAGADAQNKASQTKSQQMLDELAGRIGMTGVTGTVDDLERRQAAERINQLNSTNAAASNAGFDLIRNNYRDFLGDKVSQANASGVMSQVGLMDAINALRAEQAAAAGSGGGGGGGGGGGRRRSGGGSGSGTATPSTSAAAGITSPMPTPPGPISGVKNLENPANWQGGRVGSPSIAVKRYPGVSNPTRAGFPGKSTPPKVVSRSSSSKSTSSAGGGGGSWSKPKVVVAGRKGSPSAGVAKRRKKVNAQYRQGRR